MIGLLVILVVGGYLLVALLVTYFVVKLAGKRGALRRGKFIAGFFTLFVFWLIPFWDWIPTVVYHKHLCDTEAGTKIYRSVEGVEGFLAIGAGGLTMAEEWGYKYIDMNLSEGIRRPRKNKNAGPPLYFLEPPSTPSLYGYKYDITRGLPWNAVKFTDTTYVIATGEVLGVFTDFSYTAADPNVSMTEWRKPWLSGQSCFGDRGTSLPKEMVLKTLKPINYKIGR